MKKFSILLLALSAWVLGNCLLAPTDAAANISRSIDANLYGYLNQHDLTVYKEVACGPTAVVNSLVYLQNQSNFGGSYGNKLVPGVLRDVGDRLIGSSYMCTTLADGTFADRLAYGKHTYIEEKVAGITTYEAQSCWGWTHAPEGEAKPDWYQTYTTPTKDFISDALGNIADVEILLQWIENGKDHGHYLTVNSFNWTDNNGNLTIDKYESTIGYINPWVGAWGSSYLWEQGGKMYTDYATDSWIGAVVAVHGPLVIPEPATLLLLGLGGLTLLRKRRA
jgi:hypothetical protein